MRAFTNPAVRRLIRRELTRNKGRSAVLFLLTFLPLAFIFTVTIGMSGASSPSNEWQYGQADAFFNSSDGAALNFIGDPHIVAWTERRAQIFGTNLNVSDAPIGDPLLEGFGGGGVAWNDLPISGRLPTAPGEVAVSERLLNRLDPWRIDDATLGWSPSNLTIVGIFGDGSFDDLFLVAPGESSALGLSPSDDVHPSTIGLLDWGGEVPASIASEGPFLPSPDGFVHVQVRGSEVLGGEPEPAVLSGLFAVGLSIATGAIAFAAWGSSMRRRLRDVGILAATGADRTHLGAIQGGQAFVLAALGTVSALIVAIGVVLVFPIVEGIAGTGEGETSIPLSATSVALLVPAVVVIGVATLAGWWPAKRAAAVPLTTLLAGRVPDLRGIPGSSVLGCASVVAGLGLLAASTAPDPEGDSVSRMLFLGALGLIAVAAGVLPILSSLFRRVGAPRIGAGLAAPERLVLRNASRHAGRSAAAVLGIGAIVAAVWAGAVDAQEYRTDSLFASIDWVASDGAPTLGPGSSAIVIGGRTIDERSERTNAVIEVLAGGYVGPFAVSAFDGEAGLVYQGDSRFEELTSGNGGPLYDVELAESTGERRPEFDLMVLGIPNGVAHETAAELAAIDGTDVSSTFRSEAETAQIDADLITQLVLLAVGFLVAALVTTMIAVVVAAEVRDDLGVVAMVGTSGNFRRRFLVVQTFLYSAGGVSGGVVMGTLIRFAVDDGLPIPWHVVGALVALPFLLAAGAALFTSRSAGIRPRPDFGMAVAAP